MSFANASIIRPERRLAPRMPSAYYSLHALVNTLRQFADQEGRISALLNEMERTGNVSATATRELQQVLSKLPLFSLENELESLSHTLRPVAA